MDHPEAVLVSWDRHTVSYRLCFAESALVVCVDVLPLRNNALRSVEQQFPFTCHVEEDINCQW